MHYERLKHLAGQGDAAAAAELQREATHRGDTETLAFAVAAQHNKETLIQQATLAWEASSWDALRAWTSAIGAPLSRPHAEHLDALIAAVNEAIHRPQHHLKRADVLAVLTRALASKAQCSDIHTGFGAGSLRCAVVLAASTGDAMTLGIAHAPRQNASPGTAWPAELRPWRPDTPSTQARLQAWASQTAPDRLHLPILRHSTDHPLKALNPRDDAAIRAWTHRLKKAMRGSLSPEKWTELCALLQDPADETIAAERIEAIRHNPRNTIPWARADWLDAALKAGAEAKAHWHLTWALALTSRDQPLTQTCAAMQGLTDLHLDFRACVDPEQHNQSLKAIGESPYLINLKSLFVVNGEFGNGSLQALFAPPTLPLLDRLVLAEAVLPAQHWPLLQRPLSSLHVETKAFNTLDVVLRWLHDSPHKPEQVSFRPWLPAAFAPTQLDLTGVKTLSLSLPPYTHAPDHGDGLAVILQHLRAPTLSVLYLSTPRVTPSLIDALVALGQTLPKAPSGDRPRMVLREGHNTLAEAFLQRRPDSDLPWNHPLGPRLLREVAPLWFLSY